MNTRSHDEEGRCPQCGNPIPTAAVAGWCPRCLLATAAVPTEAVARSPVVAPPVEQVAGAFPQLEQIELIGVGGMGAVYRARQPRLDRWVAVKILPARQAQDAAFAERFLREARLLARLVHPQIVTVYDFGQAGEFFYLLMEYVDGVNLRQAMRAGRFTPAQALSLVPQLCDALQFAHDRGVMHRDIKPENILLDGRGHVKLVDFGIAKILDPAAVEQALTVTGGALGTPQYMAPEQIERPADVDHRADIYSLGVVLYELLTGELPLGRFAAPSAKTPLDARVDEIVLRALAKERELRQQTAGEVRTAVENLAGTPLPESSPPDPGGREDETARRIRPAGVWRAGPEHKVGLVLGVLAYVVVGGWTQVLNAVGVVHLIGLGGEGTRWSTAFGMAVAVIFVQGAIRNRHRWWGSFRRPSTADGALDTMLGFFVRGVVLLYGSVLAFSIIYGFASAASPGPGGPPFILMLVLPFVPWVSMGVAWRREARRRPGEGSTEDAGWMVRLGSGLLVYALLAEIMQLIRRTDLVQYVLSWGYFLLPAVFALWSQNRWWRALALPLAAYVLVMNFGTLGWLGWQAARSGLGEESGFLYQEYFQTWGVTAGVLGMAAPIVVAGTVLLVLLGARGRRAFGLPPRARGVGLDAKPNVPLDPADVLT